MSETKKKHTITMDDIARLAQVSKPTVSRALNNSALVAPETRAVILKIAQDLGYAINRHARKLRSARADTVVVVLDARSHPWERIADPFVYELLAGVSEALSVRNLDLLLSPGNQDNTQTYKDMLAAKAADGFIFLGQGTRDKEFAQLARDGVPFVVWGAAGKNNGYCTVGSDNFKGGLLAGEYFLSKKRRHILFIGNVKHKEIRERRDGLYASLTEAEAKNTALKIEKTELLTQDFSYRGSFDAVQAYLKGHPCPDGIFAFSDTSAMAAITALREAGVQTPADCSVVGYNDIPQAEHFIPPLTTIRQDSFSAGSIMVEKLVQSIEGSKPKSIILPTNLILRES